uniref:Uncharacterized protein n=1 Tax=Aegilops tauschii subsp. strangulata TaxID=200361 RepID=A0A452XIF3_AEGTS
MHKPRRGSSISVKIQSGTERCVRQCTVDMRPSSSSEGCRAGVCSIFPYYYCSHEPEGEKMESETDTLSCHPALLLSGYQSKILFYQAGMIKMVKCSMRKRNK